MRKVFEWHIYAINNITVGGAGTATEKQMYTTEFVEGESAMKKIGQWTYLFTKNVKCNQYKLLLPVCCMFFLNAVMIFPQDTTGIDLKIPALNLDMDSYIQEETSTWLSFTALHGNNTRKGLDLYASLYTNIDFQKDGDGKIDWNDSTLDLNFYFPLKIRINDYFSIPVYGSYFGTDLRSKKYEDFQETANGLLWGMGSGLIFTSKFGTLAGLAGFKLQMTNTYDPSDESNISSAVYLIPIINASNYPLLGAVFKTLGGYLGLNENKISNYSVSLVSKPIDFGFMQIDSIDAYLNSLTYNFEAEAKNYGARLNVVFPIPIGFGIDAGYRVFSNAANNAAAYKDGWFAKLIYIVSSPGIRSGLYASFDTIYYPLPKFGLEGFFNMFGLQEAVFMELGFPDDRFEFTLGGRIYLDYEKLR
jgi:hypothetical protein